MVSWLSVSAYTLVCLACFVGGLLDGGFVSWGSVSLQVVCLELGYVGKTLI